MIARIFHENGEAYDLPVTQVVVYADNNVPVSVTYVESGHIMHCDIGHKDWATTLSRLGVKDREEA